jgi:predicted small lipoprotein YifL
MSKTTIHALFALAALIGLSACGPGGPNSNLVDRNANASNSANSLTNSATPEPTLAEPAACKVNPMADRATAVQNAILTDINADTELKTQFGRHLFNYMVTSGPGANPQYLIIYFEGGIRAHKTNYNKPFKDLIKLLDPYVSKTCGRQVVLVKTGTLPPQPSIAFVGYDGFMWSACDDPDIPCPGGECKPTCSKSTE